MSRLESPVFSHGDGKLTYLRSPEYAKKVFERLNAEKDKGKEALEKEIGEIVSQGKKL